MCVDGSEADPAGSWEAGENGAMPGLIMPGTPLLGARYFQEIAGRRMPWTADEIAAVGLDVEVVAGEFSGCIEINDTNPSEAIQIIKRKMVVMVQMILKYTAPELAWSRTKNLNWFRMASAMTMTMTMTTMTTMMMMMMMTMTTRS